MKRLYRWSTYFQKKLPISILDLINAKIARKKVKRKNSLNKKSLTKRINFSLKIPMGKSKKCIKNQKKKFNKILIQMIDNKKIKIKN